MSVPVLLYHDLDEHILITSDLGRLPNLSECFGDLQNACSKDGTTKPCLGTTDCKNGSLSPAAGLTIGQRIGSFFALLHDPQNVKMIGAPPYNDVHFLTHKNVLNVVLEQAIKPVLGQLRLFPHLATFSEASAVYGNVEADFLRKAVAEERVIALGDCWTGVLLIDVQGPPNEICVGVIDWEFSSIGRGVNGDIAQLLAHLHLFQLAAAWHNHTANLAVLSGIVMGLTTCYREQSEAIRAKWLPGPGPSIPEPDSLCIRVMRSAFLAHGAEMISNAFWRDWACDSVGCCGRASTKKEHCKLVRRMVERGWWYLQHAKENGESFVQDSNWAAIQHERMVLPLFYDQSEVKS